MKGSVFDEKYSFFRDITGVAMQVHSKYRYGLLESAYEAAMKYLLELKGYKVERQVFLPIYWDEVQLDQHYRIDLFINGNVIVELKALSHVESKERRQLFNYMNITHQPFGMLINFSETGLYSEWYERDAESGKIIKLN